MCLLESETRGSDKPFELRSLSRETISNKGDFVDHSLPGLSLAFTCAEYLEHLFFGHGLDLLDGYLPLACLFLSFLFDHIAQHLGPINLISVEQIGGYSSIFDFLLVFNGGFFFFVGFDILFHLNLLLEPLLSVQFTLDAGELLGFLSNILDPSSLLLSHSLVMIETLTEALLMQLHVIILRLYIMGLES